MRSQRLVFGLFLLGATALPAQAGPSRNILIFVADGLRYASVTPETAPTMWKLRHEGVDFANSHAVYPTVTTANASAIATGHQLGDTGNYANTLYFGFPVTCRRGEPTTLTFLEDDCVLRAVKDHFGDGYLGQRTLLQAAKGAGYNSVIVGKKGPAAIQWLNALNSEDDAVDGPLGVFIDEATNHPKEIDGSSTMSTVLHGDIANDAFGATGLGAPPFTTAPNLTQQAYLLSVTTQVLIPNLKNSGRPFAMLFWSRDPDTTQHGAHDSDGSLVPGINGTDSRAAIYNADSDLKGILEALKQWGLADNTDVFVIADHGFSTIAKGIPTAKGTLERSSLAAGFVAIDVARWLGNQKIFDPNQDNDQVNLSMGQRPGGDALIGPSLDAPVAMVAANGGSDFVYVSDGPNRRETAKLLIRKFTEQPYVGALFVDDSLLAGGNIKDFPGALPLSDIGLIGSATVPRPAIVVGFRSFVVGGCHLGVQMCTAEIADTGLQTGQGMHGSFSRTDTRNFMAAMGPDFKAGFVDQNPVGNVDVAPTLAHVIGVDLTGPGELKGRVVNEAFKGGKAAPTTHRTIASERAANGFQTVLDMEEVGGTRYFDAAGDPGRIVGLKPTK